MLLIATTKLFLQEDLSCYVCLQMERGMPMREAWGQGQYGGRPVPMDVSDSYLAFLYIMHCKS